MPKLLLAMAFIRHARGAALAAVSIRLPIFENCSPRMLVLIMKSMMLILFIGTVEALFAEERLVELDPAQTHIQFTLADVIHTVHGSFKLKRGVVDYNFATGKCTGEIIIDARSGKSGSEARDKRMHKSILESDRYPEITFIPEHVEGTLSHANVQGSFQIHGQSHQINMRIETVPDTHSLEVKTQFVIPYVAWGMKNPSTLFLRVGDQVNIDVEARGHIRYTDH